MRFFRGDDPAVDAVGEREPIVDPDEDEVVIMLVELGPLFVRSRSVLLSDVGSEAEEGIMSDLLSTPGLGALAFDLERPAISPRICEVIDAPLAPIVTEGLSSSLRDSRILELPSFPVRLGKDLDILLDARPLTLGTPFPVPSDDELEEESVVLDRRGVGGVGALPAVIRGSIAVIVVIVLKRISSGGIVGVVYEDVDDAIERLRSRNPRSFCCWCWDWCWWSRSRLEFEGNGTESFAPSAAIEAAANKSRSRSGEGDILRSRPRAALLALLPSEVTDGLRPYGRTASLPCLSRLGGETGSVSERFMGGLPRSMLSPPPRYPSAVSDSNVALRTGVGRVEEVRALWRV